MLKRWKFTIAREPEAEAAGGSFLGGAPANPAAAAGAAAAAGVAQDGQPGGAVQWPEWHIQKYGAPDPARFDDIKYWRDEYAPKVSQGYSSAERMISSDKVPVPTDWNDEEQVARWAKAGGWPDKADDYEFKRPELPKDLPYDEDGEKFLRSVVHEAKLSKKQAEKIYDNITKLQLERHAAWHEGVRKERGELEQSLIREHGPNVEAVKSRAMSVVAAHADGEFRQYLDESGLGNDPRMVRFLDKVARAVGGDTRLAGKPAPAPNQDDIKRQISDYRAQHAAALMSKSHPDHDMRLRGLEDLYKNMHGE